MIKVFTVTLLLCFTGPSFPTPLENFCMLMDLNRWFSGNRFVTPNVLPPALPRDRPVAQPPMHQQAHNLCHFCKRNGEQRGVYLSHNLRGARGVVTCPILRRYKCPICGATGDDAHTVSYCPKGIGLSTVTMIQTPRKACGCQRNCRHSNVLKRH